MNPYYRRCGVKIYLGDCRELLPSIERADCVITDPPYASGAQTEAKKTSSGAMVRGQKFKRRPIENDQMTTGGYVWLMSFVSREIYQILPPGGSLLCFTDWRQWINLAGVLESSNLRLNQMVVWDKASMGLGHGFRNQHELVLHSSKGTPTVFDRSVGNVIRHPRAKNKDHPSPKPVGLISDLLKVCAEPWKTILDPFMGVGPTLLAARDLDCCAIGIELNEIYCEIAAKRLEETINDQ